MQSWAYYFSAVAPSGQTLYYNIVDGNAQVTYQNGSFPRYTTYPTGDLTIPSTVTFNGITYSVTSIGNEAFYECTGLTSVTIPYSVTSIGDYAFEGCNGLTSIVVESGNTVYDSRNSCNAIIETATNTLITGCMNTTIPNSVTSIGWAAFEGCTGLTSITIPNSVTSISGNPFPGCSGITSIGVASGNTVYDSRNNCNAIIETASNTLITGCMNTTIPNSVTSIGDLAFANCIGLCNLDVPSSVTSIGDWAFADVKNVSYNGAATGSPWMANTVNGYIDGPLVYTDATKTTLTGCCTSIEGAVIIPNTVTSIGDGAFWGCYGLTTVNFNAAWCTYMDGSTVFSGCTSFSTLNIGDNVQTIPNDAFNGCSGLTSVTIPNSVFSIGSTAFQDCTGLTSLTIGNAVTSIGSGAFSGCTGLTEIHSHAQVAPTLDYGYGVFYGVPSTIPVYILCAASASFHSEWSFFTNFIEEDAFTFSAVPADNQMGTVDILTSPTCYNPEAYIQASANSGYRFDHWSDNSTSNPYTLEVTEDTELIAYFAPDDAYYTVTAESSDPSMGRVTGGGSYTSGTTATLTASPYSGYHFSHWQDYVTSNPRTITVTTNATYTAFFEPDGGDQPSDNAPSIACVGVDMNGHNVVRWEARQGVSVVRYNIYREGLGGYSQVGYVNATNATEYSWVDDNSNTATQAYSYKLSEVASNGTESNLSTPHTTIHLQISQGQGSTWNLSWTPYVGFNYSGYRIYRGTSSASMSLLTELLLLRHHLQRQQRPFRRCLLPD